jgi:hypothetical protein
MRVTIAEPSARRRLTMRTFYGFRTRPLAAQPTILDARRAGGSRVSAVLVVRPSSLGDIVHASALVADVREHRPGTAVDWVVEEASRRSSRSIRRSPRRARRAAPLAQRAPVHGDVARDVEFPR